jgi:hypothetical protein
VKEEPGLRVFENNVVRRIWTQRDGVMAEWQK